MAHSLNLSGVCAASSCTDATAFFAFAQNIYVFLSASTNRWKALKDVLEKNAANDFSRTLLPKRLSETRWSARADALRSLAQNYKSFHLVMIKLSNKVDQTAETHREATALLKKLKKFETAFLTILWNTLLTRVNETSKLLQSTSIELSTAVALLQLLSAFLVIQRENFGEYYQKTLDAMTAIGDVTCEREFEIRRARRPRRADDDSLQPAVVLS